MYPDRGISPAVRPAQQQQHRQITQALDHDARMTHGLPLSSVAW